MNAIHKGKLRSWIVRTHLLFPASYFLGLGFILRYAGVCQSLPDMEREARNFPGRQSDSMTRHKNFFQHENVRQDF
jgi:hypothetical protein